LFGYFITNPILLFSISTIITIHSIIVICSNLPIDDDSDSPTYMFLSYFFLPVFIYYFFTDGIWVESIKRKLLVKMGRRAPDNWDNEKL
jgi:hypothetical protein